MELFTPSRPFQTACGVECAIALAAKKRVTKSRKEDRYKRDNLKTRGQWMKDAQSAFNAYIRERDKKQTCICCGKPLNSGDVGGHYDCGHYRSVGSAPHLRFDEFNAHAQRKQCNRWGSGRAVDYRIGLIQRIGIKEVERLESDNSPKKYTIEDLQSIIQLYRNKLKLLKNA